MVTLYNRARLTEADIREFYRRVLKEINSLTRAIEDIESRTDSLESSGTRLTFHNDDQIDNDRFNSTPFSLASTIRNHHDPQHGIIALPRVDASSLSKLFFTNSDDQETLPTTLETRVVGDPSSADTTTSVIDTSAPELSILRRLGRIWERNVIAGSPSVNGAQLTFYVKVPTDLFTTDRSNAIMLHPFPTLGVDITEIAYTTAADVLLQDSDSYVVINATGYHTGNATAIGWVAPGGWVGDTARDAGPKLYYFDPKPITGLRIKLRQRNYYKEADRYVYTYGLSALDLRYDKFLSTGKAMIRFNAPAGRTISKITDVQPQMWNTAESSWSDVFSYRVIWETANNSGIYTLTPVSNSSKVWIEVTLNETPGKGTPALSGLTISYS
ncbi:MAG TPA: hypothetical protein VJ742_12130 [Nitrososphaera sp.]|nr:hypothetical protein [Nitrososphaera sp.]